MSDIYDLDSTLYVPHYFPTLDFEWQPNFMWQTLNFKGKQLGLKMEKRRFKNVKELN